MAPIWTLDRLQHPIVAAPMAGGPSTPLLAAAVSEAGGLGFLAGGYKAPDAVAAEIGELRARATSPFGVNLFVPSEPPVDGERLRRYLEELEAEAGRYGTELGAPRWTDDGWSEKVGLVLEQRPAVASFTFGCPPADLVDRLHEHEVAAWCTITTPEEARAAFDAGVDALVVQGAEAGAHRGSFEDDADEEPLSLLPLLRLVAATVPLPLVASGGIADGAGVAAALSAGASAAQIGSGFLLCPEAGTADVHRDALRAGGPTELTRAFTGRRARGIANRFLRDHSASAPSAYPHVHYATAPIRAAAREAGDPDGVNLWAGQAHPLAEELPAAELVRRWGSEARAALAAAGGRWGARD